MRNPWILAQLIVAGILLVISLIGVIGTLAGAAELAFSFQGGIQAFAIFPGLVLSLIVNTLLMRRTPPGLSLKVMLGFEFGLIAALVLFHFYTDPAGATFGLAIITWPVVIALAIAVGIVAGVRLARGR